VAVGVFMIVRGYKLASPSVGSPLFFLSVSLHMACTNPIPG
jgi:hypothetical protein